MVLSRALPRFIAAAGVTNLADGVAVVVWAWLASLMTRDPLYVALMPVALRLPWFLFALPAGIVTDRVDRRSLILAMDFLRAGAFALVTLILIVVPLAEPLERGLAQPALFSVIFVLALVVGGAEVFRDNTAQTMLPSIVSKDRLEYANGRLWSVELVGNSLIGPPLGAFLIAVAVWMPFALNAVAFVGAIILIRGLKGSFAPAPRNSRDWRAELREGWDFLRQRYLLRILAVITGFWNLLFHMVSIALVLYVQENLGLDATAYGLLFAGAALGGIAGGSVAEGIVKRLGAGATARLSLALTPVSFLLILLAPNGWCLGAALALFEFWGLVWNTVSVSYRQRLIPDELLGRVNSMFRLLAWGMIPVGLLVSGLSVRLGEAVFDRQTALTLPLILGLAGGLALALWGNQAIRKGFTDQNDA